MLTASLQSTWDSQKGRQRPRYGTSTYSNYQMLEAEGDNKNVGHASNSRNIGGKSAYNNSNYHQHTQLEGSGNSELPSLKVPQMSFNRGNSTNSSAGQVQTSPRANKEAININKKYRASSRQSSHGHKGVRRHHHSIHSNSKQHTDHYGTNGGEALSSGNNAPSSHVHNQKAPVASHTGLSPSDAHVLPQILPGTSNATQMIASGGAPSMTNKRSLYINSKPTSPNLSMVNAPTGITASAPVMREFTNGNMLLYTEEHQNSAVMSIRGMKPGNPNWINQDNLFITENFDGRDIRLYCVLDGHGEHGHLVSKRCRENFKQFIKSSNMEIEHAFNMMQNDLNAASDFDDRCSGATCVLASIYGGKLSVYNCGDSRAVLGRRNPNGSIYALAMSKDHKPDKPDERKRILSAGGHLGCRQVLVNQPGRGPVTMPVGPCRVWYQNRGETLGLAMSRSLGDSIVHKSGVSAEPELLERVLDDYDEFLILATDGVWDVVDNNHAVQMVQTCASKSVNWNPIEAAGNICRFARSRWEKLSPMIDDITCIVVKMHR